MAVAHQPIVNFGASQGLRAFLGRYARWAVLHRSITGRPVHLAQALLNPVLLAAASTASEPSLRSALALGAVCAGKMALDGAAGRALRPGGYRLSQLALVPAKDLLVALPWGRALFRSVVRWRGNRIRVLDGTRIAAQPSGAPGGAGWVATPGGAR